jgi:hypothetical protein
MLNYATAFKTEQQPSKFCSKINYFITLRDHFSCSKHVFFIWRSEESVCHKKQYIPKASKKFAYSDEINNVVCLYTRFFSSYMEYIESIGFTSENSK